MIFFKILIFHLHICCFSKPLTLTYKAGNRSQYYNKGSHPSNVAMLLASGCSYFKYTDQWLTHEFCSGGSTNSVEDRGQRERASGGGSPLSRGSGGSCNLVQEISFHMAKFSRFLVL